MLNQSYTALSICNIKKAFILVLLGKAEIVASDNVKEIRSTNGNFEWPIVIKLKKFVNVPFRKVILSRKNIFKRDQYKCAYCGRSDLPLTIDHIIPRSKGGADSWENLITACFRCNSIKGDRTSNEADMKMLFKPYKPSHILFLKNSVGRLDERWKPYLYEL